MHGLQISGLGNVAKSEAKGGQVSGLFNISERYIKGFQITGGINFAQKTISGVQVAGFGNSARKEMKGFQLAGAYNYAKHLKGVQFGVVNIADSSSGYSIGLINIVKKGKGAFSVFANEMLPVNLDWKSGNRKLYSIFTVGSGIGPDNKAYTFGFGLGKEFVLNKNLRLSTEVINQNFYLGQWENLPVLYRFQTALHLKLGKRISLFAGPSFAILRIEQKEIKKGYQSFSDTGFFRSRINDTTNSWVGWQGGLIWNYGSLL